MHATASRQLLSGRSHHLAPRRPAPVGHRHLDGAPLYDSVLLLGRDLCLGGTAKEVSRPEAFHTAGPSAPPAPTIGIHEGAPEVPTGHFADLALPERMDTQRDEVPAEHD